MKQSIRLFSISVLVFVALGVPVTRAATFATTWLGADLLIQYPDSVIYGNPFDISFSVDVSSLPEVPNAYAFTTYLRITDTVDVSGSTWEYTFISDSAVWNFTWYGTLGDYATPYTHDASGYSINSIEPTTSRPNTWLYWDTNDQVVWTLHDLVLLDDTSFNLTLDEYLNPPPASFGFDVLIGTPVPEPSTALFLVVGLTLLAAFRKTSPNMR